MSQKTTPIFPTLWALFKSLPHQQIAYLACVMVVIGFIFSRALLSIGMIVLVGNAVINAKLRENVQAFFNNRAFVAISLVFFLYFLSGLFSTNLAFGWEKTFDKFPFLIIPLGFAALRSFPKKVYHSLLLLFVAIISWSGLEVLWEYWQHYDVYNTSYEKGRVVPTPINHIRYSLMVAYSILIMAIFVVYRLFIWRKWERWIYGGLGVFLLFFLHVLAVRSGILALYVAAFVLLMVYLFQKKAYKSLVFVPLCLGLLAYGASTHIPSLKNKWSYTKYSLNRYWKGENVARFSDSKRIISIIVGIELGNQYPILGTGTGDIRTMVKQVYQQEYPDMVHKNIIPHNQWVYVYCVLGVLGLMVFSYAIVYPIFWRKSYQNPLLLSLSIIVLSSFLIEPTLERQTGIGFYVFFTVLALAAHHSKQSL